MKIGHNCVYRLIASGIAFAWSVFALLLFSPSAFAATIYVSPSGSNANTGLSAQQPVRTIQRGYDLAQAGDTVFLLPGIHTERSIPSDASGTGSVLPTDETTLNALCVVYAKSGTSQNRKITFECTPWSSDTTTQTKILLGKNFKAGFWVRASWIKFRYLRIIGCADLISDARARTLNQELVASYQSGQRPAQAGFSADEKQIIRQGGIVVSGAEESGRRTVDADGNVTYPGNWFTGQWPKNIEIERCNLNNLPSSAINVYHWADRVSIRYCDIYNNCRRNTSGTSAINFARLINDPTEPDNVERMVVEGNRVFSNANRLVYVWDGTITDGNGFILDVSNTTDTDGKVYDYAGRVSVRNNVFYNNGGAGIAVTRSRRADILHNTCYQNTESPELRTGATVDVAPGKAPWFEIGFASATECVVLNNIIYGRPDATLLVQGFSGNTVNYNLVYRTSGTIPSAGTTTIKSDPLFVDTANANFHLRSTSPAINTATPAGVTKDRDQVSRPQGAAPDLGAYEWIAVSGG